ncbi:MAG: DUF3828 domain-containing protein [Pyrinomonadaceae bacterium]
MATSYICTPAQTVNTPEGRTRDFYSWYLKLLVRKQDPIRNKTIIKSHLSIRLSRWLYSKVNQSVNYDVFVGSRGSAIAGVASVDVGEAVYLDDDSAALHVTLGAAPDEEALKLQVILVKERGKWKIDRVAGLFD